MFCPKCYSPAGVSAFCGQCGTATINEGYAPPPGPPPTPAGAPPGAFPWNAASMGASPTFVAPPQVHYQSSGHGKATMWRVAGAIVILVVTFGIISVYNRGSSGNGSSSAAQASVVKAYNTLSQSDSKTTNMINSGDPTTQTDGINAQVAAHQAFDNALTNTSFPSGAQADTKSVLVADAAIESDLGGMVANVNDVAAYNVNLDQLNSDMTGFATANAALNADLGIVHKTSP